MFVYTCILTAPHICIHNNSSTRRHLAFIVSLWLLSKTTGGFFRRDVALWFCTQLETNKKFSDPTVSHTTQPESIGLIVNVPTRQIVTRAGKK